MSHTDIEVTFVAAAAVEPDSYPAAVDVDVRGEPP
jgi:hypothetical protein